MQYFPHALAGLAGLFPSLVLLIVWLVFWRPPFSGEGSGELRFYRRIVLVFVVAAAWALGFHSMRAAQPSLYAAISMAFFPLAAAAVIAYGAGSLHPAPAPSDDPARAFRAYACRAGYLVAMAMLGALYFAMVYEPRLVRFLLGSAIFLGLGVPSAIFLGLEWRARKQHPPIE